MVTEKDVMERLGISASAVEMAIYSGALPPHDSDDSWDSHHVEPFLVAWEGRISRRHPKMTGEAHLNCISKR